MQVKKDFILRRVAGSAVVVAVGENVEKYHFMLKLNKSGERLFAMLQKGASRGELADALCDVYGIDEDKARRDADAFADSLVELGVAAEI